MPRRAVRGAAVLVAVLLAAACGQKPSAQAGRAYRGSRIASEARERVEETVPAPDVVVGTNDGSKAAEAPPAPPAPPGEEPAGAPPAVSAPAASPIPGDSAAASQPPPRRTVTRSASGPAIPDDGATASERARRGAHGGARPGAQTGPSPSNPPAPGTPAPPPEPPTPPRKEIEGPVDRTGVTPTKIRIGVHAPVTGAAPFPESTFEKSKDLYWKYLAETGGVYGRNVEVVFRDDEFDPTKAVQGCRDLVEKEKVFALIGVAGSDQITACARYAETRGVPYFSAGVNEDGLSDLNYYFALSQTYSQQSDTLVSLIKNTLHATNIAVVVASNAALNEANKNFIYAATQAGLRIVRASRVAKTASDAELLAEANQLKNSGAQAVYLLMAPVNFIKLATNAQAQAYSPTWFGPGITNGLQIVAQAGCPSIGSAKFLSPFPQLDAIDELDPNYRNAYSRYIGGPADDIGILQWGLAKSFHQVLLAAGPDLSRQSLFATLTSGQTFKSNVFPDVRYDGRIRFGASRMHLLEADCGTRSWKTTRRFVSRADF